MFETLDDERKVLAKTHKKVSQSSAVSLGVPPLSNRLASPKRSMAQMPTSSPKQVKIVEVRPAPAVGKPPIGNFKLNNLKQFQQDVKDQSKFRKRIEDIKLSRDFKKGSSQGGRQTPPMFLHRKLSKDEEPKMIDSNSSEVLFQTESFQESMNSPSNFKRFMQTKSRLRRRSP